MPDKKSTPYDSISSIAKFYDVFLMLTGYTREIAYFIDQLPFEKDAPLKVLDTACGTGPYTMTILKKYPNAHITSFDLNLLMGVFFVTDTLSVLDNLIADLLYSSLDPRFRVGSGA